MLTTKETDLAIVSQFMPAMQIEQVIERRNIMVKFVEKAMVKDTDFGVIPGTGTKPTLLKPGAEKLCTLFGLTPRFSPVEYVEDWTGEQHSGEPFFSFWYRCSLYRGDWLIAEGEGSCNSMEKKYRWRWVAAEDVPEGMDRSKLKAQGGTISEFTFAVEKAETSGKYGKPAEYWKQFKDAIDNGTARPIKKRVKDGREFDAWEIGAPLYRVPNTDISDQVNTIMKMAQKRALIAATLIAVNASEFFTQDIEDMAIETEYKVVEQPAKQTPAPAARPPAPEPPDEYERQQQDATPSQPEYNRGERVIHCKELIIKARGKGIALGTVDFPKLDNNALESQIAVIEDLLKSK